MTREIPKPPAGQPPKPLGLGFALIGSELAAFTLAGVAIDYFAGFRGGFTVGFTLLGFLAAVLLAVRLLRDETSGP